MGCSEVPKTGSAHNVKLLLENGANVNAQDPSGYTALMVALEYKNTETARAILNLSSNDVDLNLCSNNEGDEHINALSIAQSQELTDIVPLLLERGALKGENGVPIKATAVVFTPETPLSTAIVVEGAAFAPTNQRNNQAHH